MMMTNFSINRFAARIGIFTLGLATSLTSMGATQQATVHLELTFGYGGAIISDHPGTTSTGVDKNIAKGGNVVIKAEDGVTTTTVIDGGEGEAIIANGRVNLDDRANVPADTVSMTNYNTADQIPDYTLEGSSDQLFDFDRFIAVADLTPGGPSPSGNNHFTNLASFVTAVKANNTPSTPYEGVVVVDISKAEIAEIKPEHAPNGINIRGTLLFNFASDVVGADYLKNSATVNINPADLSGLVATNPATFATGYPPTYEDGTKDPSKVDITGKGFENFRAADDLPAMMYSIGVFDIHGNANVCGVVYTPSFVEIEQKSENQTQYFQGAIIGGNGVFIENRKSGATTVISYDRGALDRLATSSNKGKRVRPVFWE